MDRYIYLSRDTCLVAQGARKVRARCTDPADWWRPPGALSKRTWEGGRPQVRLVSAPGRRPAGVLGGGGSRPEGGFGCVVWRFPMRPHDCACTGRRFQRYQPRAQNGSPVGSRGSFHTISIRSGDPWTAPLDPGATRGKCFFRASLRHFVAPGGTSEEETLRSSPTK